MGTPGVPCAILAVDGQKCHTAVRPGASPLAVRQQLPARDAVVKITSTAICGSDLHLYNGFVPTMKRGDVLGLEVGVERGLVPPASEGALGFSTTGWGCRVRNR